jgi:hypothetical protein
MTTSVRGVRRNLGFAGVASVVLVTSASGQVAWQRLPNVSSSLSRSIIAVSDSGRVYGNLTGLPISSPAFVWSAAQGESSIIVPGVSTFSLHHVGGDGNVLIGWGSVSGQSYFLRRIVNSSATQLLGEANRLYPYSDASDDGMVVAAIRDAQFSGFSQNFFWWDAAGVRHEFANPTLGAFQSVEYGGPVVDPAGTRFAVRRTIRTQPPESFAAFNTQTFIIDTSNEQSQAACISSTTDDIFTTALRPDGTLYAGRGYEPTMVPLSCGDAPSFVVFSTSADGQVLLGRNKFRDRAGAEHTIAQYLIANGVPASGYSMRAEGDISPNGRYFVVSASRLQPTYDTGYFLVDLGPSGLICNDIDVNNDASSFDPTDIDAFLSVFSEGPCVPATAACDAIDFNNDGALFDPCDIDSFLLVFSEGPCTSCGA